MTISTVDAEAARDLIARENQALNEGASFDYVDELYAEDVIVNMTRTGDDQPVVSREDIKALYREWKSAFPDLRVEVEHEAVEGDTVMQYVTMRGTHEGPFRGIASTGNEIAVPGFHMRRVQDGQIVETASVAGMATLLGQLGLKLPLEA
ncbi:ester cyclase [Halobium palmae]|uniref:Ester cyclase n=1 Tax=Halobium palmae TaxID=1776492 RepID=A0ABD5RXD3_9EURY